jgi:hypothetical protein
VGFDCITAHQCRQFTVDIPLNRYLTANSHSLYHGLECSTTPELCHEIVIDLSRPHVSTEGANSLLASLPSLGLLPYVLSAWPSKSWGPQPAQANSSLRCLVVSIIQSQATYNHSANPTTLPQGFFKDFSSRMGRLQSHDSPVLSLD